MNRGEYMSKKIWNRLSWNLGYFETVCPGQPENLQNCLSKHKVNIFQAMLKNIIDSHCAFNIKETQVCVWVDILPHHHTFQVLDILHLGSDKADDFFPHQVPEPIVCLPSLSHPKIKQLSSLKWSLWWKQQHTHFNWAWWTVDTVNKCGPHRSTQAAQLKKLLY